MSSNPPPPLHAPVALSSNPPPPLACSRGLQVQEEYRLKPGAKR